jgi:hypothetical protein
MSRKWFPGWVLITGLMILLLPQTVPARAQKPTLESNINCVTCHEHQYYLYDNRIRCVGHCSGWNLDLWLSLLESRLP